MRARAYVIGVVLLVLNQLWLIEAELVRWTLFTNSVPFAHTIATLTALVGLNAAMLPNLDAWDLVLVLLHTTGLFALIVILMRTGRGNQGER